jgi:Tfp pilus assembly protein PilE
MRPFTRNAQAARSFPARAMAPAYNRSMKGLIGLMIVAAISVGAYMMFLKQAAPEPGMVATQAISVTGVKNDLVAIAQAERMYYVQNGSYADLDTLQTSGTMNIARSSRDGYTYSVEPSGSGFTATARYTAPPPEMPKGVAPPRFPTLTIDQTMEIRQSD